MLLLLFCFQFVCLSEAYVTLPLSGVYSQDFFWWCQIRIGEKNFTVTVDTGSADLLVPRLNCTSCFGGNPKDYYNVSGHLITCEGSDLHCQHPCPRSGECKFNVTYGGALTEYASACKDEVAMADYHGMLNFGAVYNVTQQQQQRRGSRRRRMDLTSAFPEGLMGVAFAKLSSLGSSALDSLTTQMKVPNVFSLCLEEVGGSMTIGGAPNRDWKFVNVSVPLFWQIPFEQVFINNQSLGFPSHIYNTPGIVDSGTPFLTLPTPAFEKFKEMLISNCSDNKLRGICSIPSNETIFDGQCFSLSEEEINNYPIIEISFDGGLQLSITPEMYVMNSLFSCSDPKQYGLGISPDPEFSIIGGNVMKYFETLFDKDQMRVGFSRKTTSC